MLDGSLCESASSYSKTENDAESRKDPCMQTPCFLKSGRRIFGLHSMPHIFVLLQEGGPQKQKCNGYHSIAHLSTFRLASPYCHMFVEAFLCHRLQAHYSVGSECFCENLPDASSLRRRVLTLDLAYGLVPFARFDTNGDKVGSTTTIGKRCGHVVNRLEDAWRPTMPMIICAHTTPYHGLLHSRINTCNK